MKQIYCLLLLVCCVVRSLSAQERPQSTEPAPDLERQTEIRDSIRARGRVRFLDDADLPKEIGYRADRALLMPKMERSSIVRVGIPGWLMRLVLRGSREEFDSRDEYRAVRKLSKTMRSLHVAAFANNGVYDPKDLLKDYMRYVKRHNAEPVMQVRAPEGGVQIHVKSRRGKVRLITLVAYGDEGAAVIRLKTKIGEGDLREALALMTEAAEENAGVKIDASPN